MINVIQSLTRPFHGQVEIKTTFFHPETGDVITDEQYFTDDVGGDGKPCSSEYEEQLKFYCITQYAKNL